MARTTNDPKQISDNQTTAFVKLIGDRRVLAELIGLLADLRHVLNQDDQQVFTITVNSTKGQNPILLTVNDQEIEDYKPQFNTIIN